MSEGGIKVTVIVPTRNRCQWLDTSVGSILAQEYGNFEVVIVDDGSTDDTQEVTARLADSEGRIKVVRQSGQGQSAAVNRGLEEATGDVAIMLSDDDVLSPVCLAALAPVLEERESVVVVSGGYDLIDVEGNVIESAYTPDTDMKTLLADHICFPGVGAAFRIDVAKRIGGWNPEYRHVPDYDFWLRMSMEGDFETVDSSLGGWRMHPDQISAETREGSGESADEHIRVIDRFFAQENLPDEVKSLEGPARATALIHSAIILDPHLCDPDRRYLLVDRFSQARSEAGDDLLRQITEAAEERLRVINLQGRELEKLQTVADERLALIETLDAELRKRQEVIDGLVAAKNSAKEKRASAIKRIFGAKKEKN